MDSPLSAEPRRILIAASGTGGHLIPALLLARGFQAAGCNVEFVGSGRPLEEKIIGAAGIRRHCLSAVGLKKRGLVGAFQFLATMPFVVVQSWKLLRRFRPHAVVGVGGYASFAPVALAVVRGIPTWIHEVEHRPGLTNYVLSLIVDRVSIAFPDAQLPRPQKGVYTGHPVKPEILAVGAEKGEPREPRHLLVMGGSQGARSLDNSVTSLAPLLAKRGIEVMHQCRPESGDSVKARYDEHGVRAQVLSFIEDVAQAYRWSDVVVARSGAGTVIETDIVDRPAIFVPLPTAAGNEQAANAELLVAKGRAEVVADDDALTTNLERAIERLFSPEVYRRMRRGAPVARGDDAVSKITAGVLDLVAKRRAMG